MNLQFSDLGDFVDDALFSAGENLKASAADSAATAKYNAGVAQLIEAKAVATRQNSAAYAKALNTLTVGVVVVLAFFVLAKYVIPALK